jgi:hypothetical protein
MSRSVEHIHMGAMTAPGGLHPRPAYADIHFERIRAHNKHDGNGQSMERKTWNDPAWLSVLVEEMGEVARVLCEQRHGTYGHMDRDAMIALREELVQVAAMTVAWIDAIDLEGR